MNARKTYAAPELELFEVRSEERFTASGCTFEEHWMSGTETCDGSNKWNFDANAGGSL